MYDDLYMHKEEERYRNAKEQAKQPPGDLGEKKR